MFPARVIICEVAPRDGFQSEDQWIPTEQKIKIIRALANTGVQSIEVTSFVHPKAIPQLKDAEEVVKGIEDLTDFRKKSPILKECAGRSPMSRWEMNFGWL
ncbi:hypothetical protein [Aeribacillus pallidus]|uniref:Pyruvate carboxyltransferase domain-containing protein n=1 Tax=Aeribacillus pallidus TaxID=33936 RepID=A0A223E436_9BACI|nr:hypothetical protein [Aeribacillus pallidus]ASS89960.1 hypothetical protein AP3564_06615 [Aeribacillus pallidus]